MNNSSSMLENLLQTSGKHIVMFYEESDDTRKIIANFFQSGIEKDESCIYATDEPVDFVEEQLSKFGIDVQKNKQENRLRLFQIPPVSDFEKIIEFYDNINHEILRELKAPYRLVGRHISQIDTVRGINAEITLEEKFHNSFSNFDGTAMCIYPFQKIEKSKKFKWFSDVIQHHNAVIFSPHQNKSSYYENSKSLLQDVILKIITERYGKKVSMHIPRTFCDLLNTTEDKVMTDTETFHRGMEEMFGTSEALEVMSASLNRLFYLDNE